MSPRHVVAALVAAGLRSARETSNAARGAVDPVGTWSCVVWGHPEFGDERVLFDFAPQGVARLARIEAVAVPAWSGSRRGSWRIARCASAIRGPDGSTRRICAATISAAPGER